jgi:hypothetical protein
MHRRKYETFAPVFQASFEQTEQAGQSYSNKHNKSDKVIRTNRTSRTKLFEKTGQARQSYSNKLDKSDKVCVEKKDWRQTKDGEPETSVDKTTARKNGYSVSKSTSKLPTVKMSTK